MTIGKRRVTGFVLAALVYALDQLVKWLMIVPLQLHERGVIGLLPIFDLRWAENRGVSLGLLTADSDAMRWLLVALTAAIAIGVLVWMLREKATGEIAALALVLGGALGNIQDRVRFGFVVDYADLHFGTFRPFMIFNLADAAISIGVVIILARSFLSREKRPEADEQPTKPASES
jgi:signal peptidase II